MVERMGRERWDGDLPRNTHSCEAWEHLAKEGEIVWGGRTT